MTSPLATCSHCRRRARRDNTVTYLYPDRPVEVFCFHCSNLRFGTGLVDASPPRPRRASTAIRSPGGISKNGRGGQNSVANGYGDTAKRSGVSVDLAMKSA